MSVLRQRETSYLPRADGLSDGWRIGEQMLAATGVVLLGSRFGLGHNVSFGFMLAAVLAPLWFTWSRALIGMRTLFGVAALAIVGGLVLTRLRAVDHEVSLRIAFDQSMLVFATLVGAGFVAWAVHVLGKGPTSTLFGLGMIVGISPDTPLFASNPWRFGFAGPVTVLVLGLALWAGSRQLELILIAILIVVAMFTDARSTFGILLMVGTLLLWQMTRASPRHSSPFRITLGLAVLAVAAYNLGQAMILDGYLGERTRLRSLQQLQSTGSLILGGRPELAAFLGLFKDSAWGFGSGTLANHHDLSVAKAAMAAINYDPNNGYVEGYLFGDGYELHSMIGDLWAHFGLLGLLLVVALIAVVLRGVATALARFEASALVLFLAVRLAWNLPFSPLYSSVIMLMLLLGIGLESRDRLGRDAARGSRIN